MLAGCEMSGRVANAFADLGWEAYSCDFLVPEMPDRDYPSGGTYRHVACDVRELFKVTHPVNRRRGYEVLHRHMGNIGGPEQNLWDVFVGFPPCTHLTLGGARYWRAKREPQLDQDSGEYTLPSVQDEAADFFMEMVRAPAQYVVVENPRGDMTRRHREPDQYVQPYMFGDPLIKQTGLWYTRPGDLKPGDPWCRRGVLPLLTADNPVEPVPGARVATGGGSYRVDKRHGRGPNNLHEDSEGRRMRHIVRSRTPLGLAGAMARQWTAWIEQQEEAA